MQDAEVGLSAKAALTWEVGEELYFLPWKAAASPPKAGGQHFLSGSRGDGSRGSALDLTRKGLLFHGMTSLFFAGGRQQLPRWRPSPALPRRILWSA